MNSSRRFAGIVALLGFLLPAIAFGLYKAKVVETPPGFWFVILSVLFGLWALFVWVPGRMDSGWRTKVGFVFFVLGVSFVCLWPTLHTLSHGKVAVPPYIADNVKFGVVKGLDLQGGMRLVYTVEVDEAIRDKRDNFADEMRRDLARAYAFHTGDGMVPRDALTKLAEKVHVQTPQNDTAAIKLTFTNAADVAGKIDDRFLKRFQTELARMPNANAAEVSFKIKTEVETGIRDRAVQQAKETIGRRVDELGLREASVTVRDEDIIIEVPGNDKDAFEDIKETIRKTARLEFKMVDDEADFFGAIKDGPELEAEAISIYTERAPAGPGKEVNSHFARLVRREGETQPQALVRFKNWTKNLVVPDDHQIGFEVAHEYDEDTQTMKEIGWRTIYLWSRADITGEYITDAASTPPSEQQPGWSVSLTFSPTGAERFEEVTGANVKRRFAIILDDVVNSSPQINQKIGGGRANITMGAGDPEKSRVDAKKLELVLRSGALPAPISPSNETLIGPTLGDDAIGKGLTGAAVGSLLVLIFMALYYRKAGLVADMAVLFNLVIQLAILATFSATMTLPGIAGLALTLGMAVDANVLINERIREELRAGRSIRAAVEAGYDKAFASIVDGHVTIFISGLILAQYGSGPVKGFAITLIVGIIASLFTGVFCTRLVFEWWVRGARVKELSVGIKV